MDPPAPDGVLTKIFSSCQDDPKGSVHRAWGMSLIFILLLFVMSFLESTWKTAGESPVTRVRVMERLGSLLRRRCVSRVVMME